MSQSLPSPATGAVGGPTTTSTFDLDGDQLSLTDPDGNTTSWSYDCLGDAIGQSEVVALGYNSQGVIKTTATSSDQFDLDGNLTPSIDADGRVIDYAYSGLGQETGETWYPNVADASAGTGSDGGVSFGYDLDGLTTSASNTAASYGYQYGPQGDVTAVNGRLGGLTPNVILARPTTSTGTARAFRPISAARSAPPARSRAAGATSSTATPTIPSAT